MTEDWAARRAALPGQFIGPPCPMPCMDCQVDTAHEYYIVHHVLWHEAVGRRGGYLCVACLETRLGRRLQPDDFLGCPANDPEWRKTQRLLERMIQPPRVTPK